MKISFDLDDTLIPSQEQDFLTEKRSVTQKILGIELIRKGSKDVIDSLRKAGHEVGVYTTSYRRLSRIRFQLLTYGIKVDFVINEQLSRKMLTDAGVFSSKHPPTFNIDLHIDDSHGVKLEGEKLGFNVIVLEKNETNWTKSLLEKII